MIRRVDWHKTGHLDWPFHASRAISAVAKLLVIALTTREVQVDVTASELQWCNAAICRLGFKTCLSKTKTQQFQDQDFDVQDRDRSRLKTYKTNTGSP